MKFIAVVLLIVLASCSSTKVTVSPALQPAGKTIYIKPFHLSQQQRKSGGNNDSICTCTAEAIERTIMPFLQQKGFTIIMGSRDSMNSIPATANYILEGSGAVHLVGSSTFVESLSLEIKDNPPNGTLAVASFKGVSVRAERAGGKIGKALTKQMK
jgi:hypothetical protein